MQEIAPQQQASSAPVDCLDNAQSVGAILPQFLQTVLCSKTVVALLRGLMPLARAIALVTFLFLVKQLFEVFRDSLAEYSDAILPAIAEIVYIPRSLNDIVRLD